MNRLSFRERMKQYKLARESNPLLKYWEWKEIPRYGEGTDDAEPNNSLYLGKSGSMEVAGRPARQDVLGNWSIYYDPTTDLEKQNIQLPEVTVKPSGENYWHQAGKQFGDFVKDAAYFAPGLGVGMNLYDAYNAEMEGDHVKAAILGGMSVLPMLGKASQFGLLTAGRFGNSWARAKLISDAIVPKTGIGEKLLAPTARKINKAWDEKVRFPYMQYQRHNQSQWNTPNNDFDLLKDIVENRLKIPRVSLPPIKDELLRLKYGYRNRLQAYQRSPLFDKDEFAANIRRWGVGVDGRMDPQRVLGIQKIFSEDPRYFEYVMKSGGNPLDLETADAFIKKQFTSVRGVRSYTDEFFEQFPERRGNEMRYPSNRSIDKILTENTEGHTGGDILNTGNTGIYTSNSAGITDTFKRPHGEGRDDIMSTAAIVEYPYKNNTSLPIVQQLRNARRAIFNYDVMPDDIDIAELSKMGYVAKQAKYQQRNGNILPAFERVYFGDTPNKKLLNVVSKVDDRGLPDKNGRWGLGGFQSDLELEDRLFEGDDIGSSLGDWIRTARTALTTRKPVDNPKYSEKWNELCREFLPTWHSQDYERGMKMRDFSRNRRMFKNQLDFYKKVGTATAVAAPIADYVYDFYIDPEFDEFRKKYLSASKGFLGLLAPHSLRLKKTLHSQGTDAALNYLENLYGDSWRYVNTEPERKSKGGIIGYDGGSDGIPYQPHSEIQWYRDKDGKLRLSVTPGNGFLSAADPIASTYLEGVALGPVLNKALGWSKGILKKGALKLLPKTANKALANTVTVSADVPFYDITSTEGKAAIDNTFARGMDTYADYLSSPWVQKQMKHVYHDGDKVRTAWDDYAYPTSSLKMKASVKTPEKPYGQFDVGYEAGDGSVIASEGGGKFTLYDGYTIPAVDGKDIAKLEQIAGHEASHWLDHEVGYRSGRFLDALADRDNILSLEDWTAKMKAAGRFIDKTDDQIANYYNYLTKPTEVKAYLSEIPRTNFVNGMDNLMPYKNFEEMQEAAKGMSLQVGDILNLYADKQKAFNNLKRLLWSSPSLMMLNKKNKSN